MILMSFASSADSLAWTKSDRVRCVTSSEMDHTSPHPSPFGSGNRAAGAVPVSDAGIELGGSA